MGIADTLRTVMVGLRLKRAMRAAERVADSEERIAYCDRAFQLADALETWPSQMPTRAFVLGTLHAIRGWALFEVRRRDLRVLSERAIRDLEAASKLLTPSDGLRWSVVMDRLSIAYAERLDGTLRENTTQAIATAEAALTAVDRNKDRLTWAGIMVHLSGYYAQHPVEVAENRNRAIGILRGVRAALSRDDHPFEWAITTASLGDLYAQRNQNSGADLEVAIDLMEDASPLLKRGTDPRPWAGLMIDLSSCYQQRSNGDPDRNFERALQAVDWALSVLDPQQTPEQWAGAQVARGTLLAQRTPSNRQNVDEAIAAYEAALTVFTPDTTIQTIGPSCSKPSVKASSIAFGVTASRTSITRCRHSPTHRPLATVSSTPGSGSGCVYGAFALARCCETLWRPPRIARAPAATSRDRSSTRLARNRNRFSRSCATRHRP
jgi:tetratricopeptide (TPR) repeat protein